MFQRDLLCVHVCVCVCVCQCGVWSQSRGSIVEPSWQKGLPGLFPSEVSTTMINSSRLSPCCAQLSTHTHTHTYTLWAITHSAWMHFKRAYTHSQPQPSVRNRCYRVNKGFESQVTVCDSRLSLRSLLAHSHTPLHTHRAVDLTTLHSIDCACCFFPWASVCADWLIRQQVSAWQDFLQEHLHIWRLNDCTLRCLSFLQRRRWGAFTAKALLVGSRSVDAVTPAASSLWHVALSINMK